MYQERTAKKLLCSTLIGPGPASRGDLVPPNQHACPLPPNQQAYSFYDIGFCAYISYFDPPDKRLAPFSRLLCRRRLWIWSKAVPKLDGEITLKILIGLALASQPNIHPLLLRIEMLGSSNSSCCSRDLPKISRSRK